MERITRGGPALTSIDVSDRLTVKVRARRMHVRWRTLDEPAAMAAFDEAAPSRTPQWQEAIEEHGLEEVDQPLVVEPLAEELMDEPVLVMPGSPDEYVELRAQPAEPDEGLLMMIENDGVVQWYLPRNPAGTAVAEQTLFDAPPAPIEFRFHVPRSVLAPPAGVAAFGGGVRGAVVRFFKFRLVRDLFDRTLDRVRDWIIDNIEARNKTEGFRRFDRAAGFPMMSDADLRAMEGQRVLILNHGIFSSVEGAFGDLSDPASAVRQHLGRVYGDRIFGWDHWTVAKTPLENAQDLLARLPGGITPDILCHSRGALVTRAMLEHRDTVAARAAKFSRVGKTLFVAGANQGSQLATPTNINRLLNIYAAVASIPGLGGPGVVLKVVVGLLKVLVHRLADLPSIVALNVDPDKNQFLKEINGPLMTPTGEIVIAHANYDPRGGPLGRFLDLNVDAIFRTANDMVVPFTTAAVLDKWQTIGPDIVNFGTATVTQGDVMHTNFFEQSRVHDLIASELV